MVESHVTQSLYDGPLHVKQLLWQSASAHVPSGLIWDPGLHDTHCIAEVDEHSVQLAWQYAWSTHTPGRELSGLYPEAQ